MVPLMSAYGKNGFDEFCVNLADEMLHSYIVPYTFKDPTAISPATESRYPR